MVELIAKRYGTALYELALEMNRMDEFKKQTIKLREVLIKEIELQELLNHPQILLEDKIKIVEDVFEGTLDKEIIGLMVITLKKRRQNKLVDILTHCIYLMDENEGIIKAKVTSPMNLSKEQLTKIKDKLEEVTKKTVEVELDIDPMLIAGLTIRIGDRIIDSSIKGKLQKMAKSL